MKQTSNYIRQRGESASHPFLEKLANKNAREARRIWGAMTVQSLQILRTYTKDFGLSVTTGDLLYLHRGWYVTHSGLIRLARRNRCAGIHTQPVAELSDAPSARW